MKIVVCHNSIVQLLKYDIMMNRQWYNISIISFLLCFITITAMPQAVCANAFTLVKSEKNISLYEREVIHKDMKVREVKVEVMVKTSANALLAFLQNDKQIKQWNPKIEYVQIQPGSVTNWITYTKIDLPWPLSDQDMVVQYKVQKHTNNEALVVFNSIGCSAFPEKNNISRVHHVAGTWQLIPVNDKMSKVVYCIRSERKSSIPKSISDPFIRDNLMQSMNNLKTILEH